MFSINEYITFAVLICLSLRQARALPNLNDTSQEPIVVFSGEDAYIDCKVENQSNYTVLFKFINPDHDVQNSVIISAGNIRITSDTRFSVLHHTEHEVWVLKIKDSRTSDSGIYICEVNSTPKQQIARLLSVVTPESSESKPEVSLTDLNHNYTNCCIEEDVPEICFGLCHIKGLIENQIPHLTVKMCFQHLQSITKCLNGGRNNLGCCERQNIPSPCTSVCSGHFNLTTIIDHYTCTNYAAPMLACIAEGIETLPPQPLFVNVESLSSTELMVRWERVSNTIRSKIDSFQVNVTQLHSFDGFKQNKRISNIKDNTMQSDIQMSFMVNSSLNEYKLKDLKSVTMYEIQVTAINKFGSSLPSDAVRALTLSADSDSPKPLPSNTETDLKLPDVRKCCAENGVTLDRCLDTLCDPTKADTATLSDLMICAPWANVTFKCMSMKTNEDGWNDHSKCCQQRGVSSVCLPLCQGNVKRIDFRHFVCLDHMSAYTSCILESHNVLPSEPQNFRVSDVHHDWAILRWKAPKKLAESVLKFYVYSREVTSDTLTDYSVEIASTSPYLLDHLQSGHRYEVYATAVNKYGVSQSSVRVVFSTPPITAPEEEESETVNSGYNETACCVRASLPQQCLPLCSYRVKVADMFNLSAVCIDYLPTLIRCGTGGRNHVPCCRRRDVSDMCLNMCAGLVDTSSFVAATRCSNDFGKMLQCMEEGVGLLPGMPLGLHTTRVTNDSISIEWKPSLEDGNATHITYQVRYGKSDAVIPLHPLEHTNIMNTTETKAIITGLESTTHYSVYVTAHNMYGVSLPSLVLLVTTSPSNSTNNSRTTHAKVGPPHSLEVIHQNVDSITLKWLPPLYVPSDSSISYVIYFKAINGSAININPSADNWYIVTTMYTTLYLANLTYNTEYAVTIQAKTDKNETSSLSEVILVWTDPAIPAAVQMPIIIPAGPVIEGSNITVMCVALGTPIPQLSMFINGHLVAKQTTRHLASSITNVDRNLTSISCFAVNGDTKETRSAQSSLDVQIRFKPHVLGLPQITTAPLNGTARLLCQVSANPMPKMLWFKQLNNEMVAMHAGDNVDLITVPHSDTPFTWLYTMIIKSAKRYDTGNYICTAENQYGKAVATITLDTNANSAISRNSSSCCVEQGVKQECMSVCSLDIDIEEALSKPQCFTELDKLMICAADGSDHRQCCRRRQVPIGCLRWCAGLKVTIPSLCVLSSARDIISCFQEGKALLPGPPTNVRIQQIVDERRVIIEWSPPDKNPELVQWYRVFWRPVGSRDLMRNQSDTSIFELRDLNPEKMYEFVVKSGNHYGLSVFTDPLVIRIRTSHNSQFHSTSLGNKFIKVILSISVAIVLIICGVGATIYYYKYHYVKPDTQTRGVSFENPTYLKESGSIQIHDSRVSNYVSDSNETRIDKPEGRE